jgi:aminopeptidase N
MMVRVRSRLAAAAALAVSMTSPLDARAQASGSAIDLGPGVSRSLAADRAARLSDIRYDVSLAVPDRRSEPVTARVTIGFSLRDASAPVAIDFEPDRAGRLREVTANGVRVEPQTTSGHLLLPPPALKEGANEVTIDFDAGDAPLNRAEEFLYTIFVPARAHEALPCFDQPDLKARWTLALEVPEDWEAVANGADTERRVEAGRKRVVFAETQPISTYLFAFAAGRFTIERAERGGRAFRMFHRETEASKVARNRDALFDLHAAALEWMERYTSLPYAFGKLDFVLIPAFQFSGMEHPGAIFYNSASLLLEESATQNQFLDRASTIAHETAHMWFGDLVTMTWFTDVWMKEVFANFMAAKIVNPSFPAVNHDLRFLHAYYPLAYDVDRTAGTNAIRQPLDNLKDAGTLYGAIIYQKAPVVMRQLELLIGPGPFRDGLGEYLRRNQFGNASWPDLISILDARTPDDLAAWSRAWVEEAGRPRVATDLAVADGRIVRLAFTTRDPAPSRGLTWTEELRVALGYSDRVEIVPVRLSGLRSEAPGARGRPAPLFVLPNGGGLGYGEFHLDAASLEWLAARTPDIADALTRGSAWVTLWDAMLNAELRASRIVDLAMAALPRETDELNTQRILAYLEQAYWRFTSDQERLRLAPQIEARLRERLAAASTASLKGAFFASLRNVALTSGTLDWLARVWRGDEVVPGLMLAETDFITLAQELAVRAAPGWQAILEQQVERTLNPDRRARLQFVLPAMSADSSERDRFFNSLAEAANRRREAWVLDAVRYLNHPLRAAQAVGRIEASLALLQEIQQTGDIFFPKRWVDATLWGHRSPEAARVVRSFLDRVPASYPDRLRRIILASADDLFRAAR